ncbi:MAG: hypothetical protein R6U19_05010, partial [Bacteroidales bacterium]
CQGLFCPLHQRLILAFFLIFSLFPKKGSALIRLVWFKNTIEFKKNIFPLEICIFVCIFAA